MKIAIIQFPGSNCETESLRAVKMAGMEAEEFLWNRSASDLEKFDGYFIVGGFSYEDRSRSGIISALDPLIPNLKAEAKKGKPILGICNGAQILVETGLVPGLKNDALGAALAVNKRVKDGKVLGVGFYNAWVNIKLDVPSGVSAFTRNLKPGQFIHVPVAHGEGRFIIPEALLQEMIANNQTVYRYCDESGSIVDEFPVNPNGAVYNLAAITNPSGTIMAMMPHPERTDNGQPIFTSMRDYIAEHHVVILNGASQRSEESLSQSPNGQRSFAVAQDDNLMFSPPQEHLQNYQLPPNAFELPIELIITDNEAVTVENTLRHLGFPVSVKRLVHWEITGPQTTKETITKSGELFNPSKERVCHPERSEGSKQQITFLVRYRDDFVGQSKKDALTSRFGLKDITNITQGILWQITTDSGDIEKLKEKIIGTHILHNPYSQEMLIYT